MVDLKTLLKSKETAKFVGFTKGCFIYKLDNNFTFPIALSDLGDAAILAEEKASALFRYIDKQQKFLTEAAKVSS